MIAFDVTVILVSHKKIISHQLERYMYEGMLD